MRKDDTKPKGAHWHAKSKRWASKIRVRGEQIHIGLFDTAEEAQAAYHAAAVKYRGEAAHG